MAAEPSTAQTNSTRPDLAPWIALLFGAWIAGGLLLVLWAIEHGLTGDPVASIYHLPIYLGLAALTLLCGVRAGRAVRHRAGWRTAFRSEYATLGIGLVVLLAALVLDLGWREGVGIGSGIESGLAPSRTAVAIGVVLIAIAPLRAALTPGGDRVPRIAMLVSAGLALGVMGWGGRFQPAVSPWMERSGEFLWGSSEIWVMEGDGSLQTRLVEEADPEGGLGYASWSPDGSRIAYTRFDTPDQDSTRTDAAVWIVAANGTGARAIVDGDGMQWIPRFSPDGAWIVYTQEKIGGPWSNPGPVGPGLGAGPAGGGAVGPLTVPLPNADIWRIAADGGGVPQRLTDSPGDDRAPVYSPDGTQILFDSTRDGNTEIYAMDVDGEDQRRLTNDPEEDWGASWSPDGTKIAFNSYRTGAFEIWVMSADGSGLRQVTFGSQTSKEAVTPSWSPDGTRIAYNTRGGNRPNEIWSVAADGGDALNLSRSPHSTADLWTGGWGSDGRIVFSRGLPGAAEASPLVRENLGAAGILLSVALLAAVVVAVARTAPPFGSFTLMLTLALAIVAAPVEGWRFVPVGVVSGLAVDIAIYRSSPAMRGRIAGATVGAAFVLATGGVVLATTGLGWTPTLLLGIALAAAAIGWGAGALAGGSASPHGMSDG
jgi:Tol biopolymer transport system component